MKINEMMDAPIAVHRPTWLEISESALIHNIKYVRELTGAKRFCAVVKANAYGHGLAQVVPAALKAGADCLAVATMDEGIWLRKAGVVEPIFVLGITEARDAELLAENKLIPAVSTLDWLLQANEVLGADVKLEVALVVDTGMGRIGFTDNDLLLDATEWVNASDKMRIQSVWTHFATADETSDTYFQQQLATWHERVDRLPLADDVWHHLANSATSLWHEQPSEDMIRVGAAIYGFDASQGALPNRDLKPVMSLKSKLVHVKHVPAGTSISYGATYTTDVDEWIGTLPIGYADGYRRALQGGYVLLPDGRHAEVVGRIAMDQMMIKLPESLPVGTEVTLLGQVAGQTIRLEDLATELNTIPYEIATSMAQRLERRVVK
ncbi:alanine racemase [Weissella ceti]|uniref:Alanine racemase n=1 Tax=Weissella ceti TaxID=759620 RepID=A0ABT3E5U4_9LACO|nr:alanine racemase [Weissella ceti]MCW0953619.1 alanine racemase [Weissella ceti]